MALSTTITKKSVTLITVGVYNITLNMLYADGETVILDQNFTEPWSTGQAFSAVFFAFKAKMMAAIANYKTEQAESSTAAD